MKKLGLPQYLGYAAGDAANNLAFSMSALFLLLYYTDVAGIPAVIVGTLFLLVRIWDAFSDIFAGRAVDATMTRWGKFRPFILFGSIPLLLLSVATFSVPPFSLEGKLVYAYISYGLLGLFYSVVNIPYGSLAAAMTQVPEERAKLASFRVVGANATGLMLALVVAPQISGSSNLQQSLTLTTLAFVVVGFALYLFTFLTAREQVQRDVPKVSMRQSFATLRHNPPLLLLCLSSLMFLTGWFSLQTVGAFYARNVLGDANLYIVITLVQNAGVFLAAMVVPRLVHAMGKRAAYLLGAAIAIVCGIGLTLAPASIPAIAIAIFGVLGFGLGAVSTLMWALEADTVDYAEWTTGVRTEGITYAMFSFTRKMGQALGGAAAAYTIGFSGYVASAGINQTESAIFSIKLAAGFVPAAFIAVALLIMVFYPLTEAKYREIVAGIAARRVVPAVVAATGPGPVLRSASAVE